MKRKLMAAGGLVAVIAALAVGQTVLQKQAGAAKVDMVEVPMFQVDPFWPKPLPNHWILGMTIGVGVDAQDNVFIVHRQNTLNMRTEAGLASNPPKAVCCIAAPPVLEFNPAGEVVNSFGGESPDYTWPSSNHGITVDPEGNLWIGGNGRGDSHILEFTHDGKFIRQIGIPGKGVDSRDTTSFAQVAKISFDSKGDEAYVADGYGNHRVAVLDAHTGKFLRYWGAYGKPPTDKDLGPYDPSAPLAQQFRNPVHCAVPTDDGLVYVCDRVNDRIQVFRKDGTFVRERQYMPKTLGDGSVWDIALSPDSQQRFMYMADGSNRRVYVMDRQSLDVLYYFGDGGRQPGEFYAVHSIATDSKGNIYTTETYEGKRLQKFVYQGMGHVEKGTNLGVLWPGLSQQ